MKRRASIVVAVVAALSAGGQSALALKVGDQAPPLTVTHWVKGKPFDISKEGKGKVVVLEFWATWCGPCIQMIPETTSLYQQYKDKGLLLAAVTDSGQGQQLNQVQDFVNGQGRRMDYPVAFDKTQKSYLAYVLGAGAMGIPHSVVIDKEGKIAWFGHPAEPKMKSIIRDLLLDRYDPTREAALEAIQRKVEPLWNDFNQAARVGDWNKCLAIIDSILALDEGNFDAMRLAIAIYLDELQSVDEMRKWVEAFISKNHDKAEPLAKVAVLMLSMPDMTDRHPDLAAEAATLAAKAGFQDADVMTAVAQICFQMGNVDGAIVFQMRAVELSNVLDVEVARKAMRFYETCKTRQVSVPVVSAP